MAALQACEPSRLGPPPRFGIRVHSAPSFDERNAFMIENGSLVLSDRFVLTKAMSGSASPSPSMMKDTTILLIILEPPFTAALTFSAIKLRSYSTVRCGTSIPLLRQKLNAQLNASYSQRYSGFPSQE